MQSLFLVAVLMQVKMGASVQRDSADTTRKHSEVALAPGVASENNHRRGSPKRIPVTEVHLRTAFGSPLARALLERARAARMAQDSALLSYDATAYMRMSVGMGFSRIGRDRLFFRHENVTHVRWHRDVGAWIDVKGARTAIPIAPDEAQDETADELNDSDMTPVPYYPGKEPLLVLNGSGMVKSTVDERDLVHPLAEGSEAYYTYVAGDSVTFRLPDGNTITLRELRVRPRQSKWNVVVGSMWFDTRTGQLVRAAYRLAVPMDIWAVVEEQDPKAKKDIPIWIMPIISPMRAQISSFAVEYGLYRGRFWLPRLQSAEGDAQVSFMHVPFKFEESFKFGSINALDSLPEITVTDSRRDPPDSLSDEARDKWRDSARKDRQAAHKAERDSVRKGLKKDPRKCANPDSIRVLTRRYHQGTPLKVAMRVPCDLKALANSPELPQSIYDEGEEVFGSKERDALIAEALAMGAQPPLSIGAIPPSLKWGLEFTRFNRIEGLSSGILIDQPLGAGYTASLFGRIGHADLEPNAELMLARSNLTTTIRGRLYNRLVAANDWGNPLSFGSSVSALLFGRDEGFYYRGTGAELEWERSHGALFTWRLFGERERTATVKNNFSFGPQFIPNIASQSGAFAGAGFRLLHTKGLDPNGFRVFTDGRFEAAMSDSANAAYGRGAFDLTVTQGVAGFAFAWTMSAGASAGALPPQRRWYLGGTHTVRGQRPDTSQSGDAYWLGRFELGSRVQGLRPVVFGDLGWVGDRSTWRSVGRPMSGVGIGASALDGLIRADLARGLYPQNRVRLDMYVEAKF